MGAEQKLAHSYFEQTQGLKVIECDQASSLAGYTFKVWQYNAALSDDGFLNFEFKTDATKTTYIDNIGLAVNGGVSTAAVMTLTEAPTIQTPGTTAVTAECLNRILDTAQAMAIKSDPSGTISGGTLVNTSYVFGTRGAEGLLEYKMTLKKNTTYLLRFQNTSGGAAELYGYMQFCER